VHLDDDDLAKDYVGIPADIPDSVATTRIPTSDLPREWRGLPRPQALADLGSRWAAARETAVLAVPSAIIPHELNYLLNPLHPYFKRVRIGRPEPFSFDPRFWKP
jgi:RES domain-containing protein